MCSEESRGSRRRGREHQWVVVVEVEVEVVMVGERQAERMSECWKDLMDK